MTKLNAISEKITATLIEAIESRDYTDPGPALPWHRTGTADHLAPSNATTGNYYQGSNILFLGFRY